MRSDARPLLEVQGLEMRFKMKRKSILGPKSDDVIAVDGVDLSIGGGEVLGLVGESGSGKSTLGRCIIGIHTPTGGSILYRERGGDVKDVVQSSVHERRKIQRDIRMIFQDPFSSLNPRMTLQQIVGDPLQATGAVRGSELEDRVAEMLRRVGLEPGHMRRYPHAFSGGQRQRINIARALIVEPRLVIADEAVSALDVSIRSQVLDLLAELRADLDLTFLFISHDLSVVEAVCDRVAVMYLGRIVETDATQALYEDPRHPYTRALLSAVPIPDPRMRGTRERSILPEGHLYPTAPVER